jgi:hypothetical protein
MIVRTPEEDDALVGLGWYHHPNDVPASSPAPVLVLAKKSHHKSKPVAASA